MCVCVGLSYWGSGAFERQPIFGCPNADAQNKKTVESSWEMQSRGRREKKHEVRLELSGLAKAASSSIYRPPTFDVQRKWQLLRCLLSVEYPRSPDLEKKKKRKMKRKVVSCKRESDFWQLGGPVGALRGRRRPATSPRSLTHWKVVRAFGRDSSDILLTKSQIIRSFCITYVHMKAVSMFYRNGPVWKQNRKSDWKTLIIKGL